MGEEGIIQHLGELNESPEDWKRYREITPEDLKQRDKRNMVLYAMLISIQAAIELATSRTSRDFETY
ncbi:MAG: hypothetical protein ACTSP1_07610 [Candidatus Freyarchaeota archaeon]